MPDAFVPHLVQFREKAAPLELVCQRVKYKKIFRVRNDVVRVPGLVSVVFAHEASRSRKSCQRNAPLTTVSLHTRIHNRFVTVL